jgi:hypothetical protein
MLGRLHLVIAERLLLGLGRFFGLGLGLLLGELDSMHQDRSDAVPQASAAFRQWL